MKRIFILQVPESWSFVLFKEDIVRRNAQLSYIIADKDVEVLADRTLMGHATYPIVLAKGSIV